MKKSIKYKFLTGFLFTLIMVFGIIRNLRTQLSPLIQEYYGISYSQLGFALSFFSIGSLMITLISGVLIQKYGIKRVLLVGIIVSVIGLMSISYVNKYALLVIAVLVTGIGLAVLNISFNTLASQLFVKNKGRMMNLFHFFFGVGGILSPIYASSILDSGFSWQTVYFYAGIVILAFFIITLVIDFPSVSSKRKRKNISFLEILKDPRILIFNLMFFLHVGTELGGRNWIAIYLTDIQHRTEEEVAFYIALYFALFTLGRFLASIFVEKIDYLDLVIISSLISATLIFIGIVGPDYLAFTFSLAALFISVNFPTMQAAMFEIFDSGQAVILGLTLTTSSLGASFLGDWVIGLINDLVGIKVGYGIQISYLLILVGVILYLKSVLNKSKFSVQEIAKDYE
ncbi:MFS transporter [Halanaerocella petrolearia]